MKSCIVYLVCNISMYYRPLHCFVFLSSRSILRSSQKTRSERRNSCGGRQRTRSWSRGDAKRWLQKRSTRKRRKGGVLLRTGRRGRRSLSVCAERRQRWRRIPMPRGRESGLVALSRYWFIHERCPVALDFFYYVVITKKNLSFYDKFPYDGSYFCHVM